MSAKRILIQLILIQQQMNERLRAIEACLDAIEAMVGADGKGESDNELSEGGPDDAGNDSEEYRGETNDEEGFDGVEISDVE